MLGKLFQASRSLEGGKHYSEYLDGAKFARLRPSWPYVHVGVKFSQRTKLIDGLTFDEISLLHLSRDRASRHLPRDICLPFHFVRVPASRQSATSREPRLLAHS